MYLSNHIGLYTDFYQLTMAQGYYLSGKHEIPASFDYFFREPPFNNGYVVFAGLCDLLPMLEQFRYHEQDLAYLEEQGFHREFLDLLKNFRFQADVHSVMEGDLIFPREPVMRVEGRLMECQLIETILLNVLNFQSLIATKAARLRRAAGERRLLDFGLRRAQGLGGVQASRAALIGGVDATSNVYAGYEFDIPVTGTMAHSWIQSFDSELEAFRRFAEYYPDKCILLVDTYDTLNSGVPNAITVAQEMEERGERMLGIRIDSGDLAYLSKKARKMLDEAGLQHIKIAASDQLDELVIQSLLLEQKAPLDAFGVGTRLVTGHGDPALSGVYKLSRYRDKPTMKRSDNPLKATLPGAKTLHRYLDEQDMFAGDLILLEDEKPDGHYLSLITGKHVKTFSDDVRFEKLMQPVMKDGKIVNMETDIHKIISYQRKRIEQLPEESKRLINPARYDVWISGNIEELLKSL